MALLTVAEAAERLRVSPASVYQACQRHTKRWEAQGGSLYEPPEPVHGELPCIRVGGGAIRIPEAMLERMGV